MINVCSAIRSRDKIKYILAFSLIITIYSSVLAQSNPSSEVIVTIQSWVQENKDATENTIVNFLESYLPQLKTVEDTYYVLINIINTYPPQNIPYTIYVLFAQISSLKLDFHTASLMYHTSYTLTNNPLYLLRAAVQEFEIGNMEKTLSYISEIVRNTHTKYPTLVSAYILQSEVLLSTKTPEIAYSFLENIQYQIPEENINAMFLYQIYKLALLTKKETSAYIIHNTLFEKFPESIETQRINNARIEALPLPSLLFGTLPIAKSTEDTTTHLDELYNNTIFSLSPNAGYQVGAFSNIQNARASLEYYQNMWKYNKLNTASPILIKKIIEQAVFYQIIFPIDTNKEIQYNQIIHLKDKGIEGFLIIN